MATKNKDQLRPTTPQPTNRDKVIAQRQAQAAKGDTTALIAARNNIPEQDLLAANPGVVTVRPGQVVTIPPTGGGNMYSPTPVTNPLQGSQAFVGAGSFNAPSTNLGNYNSHYNGFQTPTTNGFQSNQTQPTIRSAQANYRPPQQTQSPAGYTNLTPSQSQNIPPSGYTNLTPSQAAPVTPSQAQQATQNVAPPRPTGVYTGDPNDPNTAAWKARWEWEARNPAESQNQAAQAGLTSAPRVMTRDEIWNMKAAQRRRQMVDQPNNYNGSFQYNTSALSPLVRNITWSIRG